MTTVRETILADSASALITALNNGYPSEIEVDGSTTLLQFAVQSMAFDCCSVLIEKGADVRRAGDQGKTLLHLLLETWDGQEVRRVGELMVELCAAGLDMDRPDFFGRTPYAILKQKGRVAEPIISKLKGLQSDPDGCGPEYECESVEVKGFVDDRLSVSDGMGRKPHPFMVLRFRQL